MQLANPIIPHGLLNLLILFLEWLMIISINVLVVYMITVMPINQVSIKFRWWTDNVPTSSIGMMESTKHISFKQSTTISSHSWILIGFSHLSQLILKNRIRRVHVGDIIRYWCHLWIWYSTHSSGWCRFDNIVHWYWFFC